MLFVVPGKFGVRPVQSQALSGLSGRKLRNVNTFVAGAAWRQRAVRARESEHEGQKNMVEKKREDEKSEKERIAQWTAKGQSQVGFRLIIHFLAAQHTKLARPFICERTQARQCVCSS